MKTNLIIFLGLVSSVLGYLEHDSWTIVELHHSLGSNSEHFTYRGNITIPSLNSGLANANQIPLSTSELNRLKVLAKQNDLYRLKATVTYPSGSKKVFLTSNKACSLLQSQFNDVLWISIDHSGFVTAITQTHISSSNVDCYFSDELPTGQNLFNTDVFIRHAEIGPVPDTASFIQKVEREREARERGDVRDNRGFFAKYWMYIVPVVLLVFISTATNQDAPK